MDCFDIERMPSGRFAVRPKGRLGTCGWDPKAWQCVSVENPANAVYIFLKMNKNWSLEDLKGEW